VNERVVDEVYRHGPSLYRMAGKTDGHEGPDGQGCSTAICARFRYCSA
jgi:hypothetical protein